MQRQERALVTQTTRPPCTNNSPTTLHIPLTPPPRKHRPPATSCPATTQHARKPTHLTKITIRSTSPPHAPLASQLTAASRTP